MYGARLDMQPHKYDAHGHTITLKSRRRRLRTALRNLARQGDGHPGRTLGASQLRRGMLVVRSLLLLAALASAPATCARWPRPTGSPRPGRISKCRRPTRASSCICTTSIPQWPTQFSRHVVLFVHGATFPARSAFDCRAVARRIVDGRSRPARLRRVCARYPRLWGLDASASLVPAAARPMPHSPRGRRGARHRRGRGFHPRAPRRGEASTSSAGPGAPPPPRPTRRSIRTRCGRWSLFARCGWACSHRSIAARIARARANGARLSIAGIPKDRIEEIAPPASSTLVDGDSGHRSGGSAATRPWCVHPTGSCRISRNCGPRQTKLRSGENPRADLATGGRVGCRHAARDGAGTVQGAQQCRPRRHDTFRRDALHFLERHHMALIREVQDFLEEPSFPLSEAR